MDQQDMLLIACGSLESREHLRSVLQARFHLLEATNLRQMYLLLQQNITSISSVILDISNWDVIAQDLPMEEASIALLKQLPVIVVADKEAYQDLTLYFRYGAADVLPMNYDPYAMLHRIETVAQLARQRRQLQALAAEQEENLRHFSDNMVDALSAIIEYRNTESGHHILRIRNFTKILMEEVMRHCPEYGLTSRLVSIISSASALHDVGKIGIPDSILTKPGPLNPEEWETMKTHAPLGCGILGSLQATVDQEYLRYAYNICRYHHERWDGNGYPDGLKGDNIPICAQVVGLADCYDALTSHRVYKAAYSHVQAVNMILGGECGSFSPTLLECFKNVTDQFAQLRAEYADGRSPDLPVSSMALSAPLPQDQAANLLEKTRAKYFCMVHYLNGFLVEVQLDTGLFQVMYNPYPELVQVKDAKTLEELTDIAACQVVIAEERDRMYHVIRKEMLHFIEQDLRRQSFIFHHRPYAGRPSGPFEMTFLRIGGINRRPSLAILCRILEEDRDTSVQEQNIWETSSEYTYICRNDKDFTLVKPGRDTYSLGGYTPDEVMEIFGGRLLDMAFPDERAMIRQEFDRQLKQGTLVRTEYRFLCKDGSVGWVVNKSRLVLGSDGQEYIQSFLYDISATKVAYDRLNETLQRYQIILAQTENVLFDLDVRSGHIDFSETWENIFGYHPSTAPLGHQLSGDTHVHPDDISLLLDRLGMMKHTSDYEMVEIRIVTASGRYLWCRVRASATRDEAGNLIRIVGVILNIDAEKQAQQKLEDKANRDSLTQLLNKKAGQSQVERYLSRHQSGPPCALIILDLDNFKNINDLYGHLFGDALLSQVSQILTSLFHSQDIIARIGGDEFMILVRGITDRQLLAQQCRRLRDMLLHAFRNDTMSLEIGCSIGIALCPEHGRSYFDLFAMADHALYHAKASGKNTFSFYGDDVNSSELAVSRRTTPIDSDNESAMGKNDITYQVFRILYQTQDFSVAVNQVLALMGQQTDVSRVYIFENSDDDTYCVNTFEWCNRGIAPEIQNLQYVSYITDIPDYQDNFNEDGVFYCHDVRELPQAAFEVVEPQGIQSMLHCAIQQNGRFMGYIGFDECSGKRLWTKEEIRILTYCSEILSMFLLKYREQEKLRTQTEELKTILDNQGQWMYILDPDTNTLKFVNEKIRRQRPDVQLGLPCYQALMGQNSPCAGCPMATLQDKKSSWTVIEDSRYHCKVLMEATRIRWQDQDHCLITGHRLPEDMDLK